MEEKDKKASPVYSETAYDDAFSTMEGRLDDLLVPFVSHMFGEQYDETAIVKRRVTNIILNMRMVQRKRE